MGHQSGAAIALFAVLQLACATGAKAESKGQYAFDLPAEDLSHAVRDIAALTGENVIAPDDLVRSRETVPLSGRFTAEQALSKLLEGTGLTYRRVHGSLVIERGSAAGATAVEGSVAAGSAEILVTGTHVRSAAPTSPLLTITRHDIDEAQPTSVEELMRRLPENLSAGVAQENFGVIGTGSDITEHGAGINLRGLGQRATLVLVNGRRVAPSGTGSFVDVSMIPVSAIDRIEILTDGASAIYGSDAVAGVVNIILKTDFRGFEAILQGGTSTDGGGRQLLAGLTAGTAWRGGNAMLSYEFRDDGEIKADQRSFTINLPPAWALFPKERRHSLYGAAHQELGPKVTLDLTANYAARDTDRSFFVAGPLVPVNAHAEARSFGGTATVGIDLGNAWRAEATGSYFRSRNSERSFQDAGLFNLFNTVNSAAEIEIKADGDLIEVPAGAVKLAVGAQTRREHYSSLFQTSVNLPTPQSGGRTVSSLYAELNAPLFSTLNRRVGLEQLVLTAAGRLEHYERLGSTFDPKFGILWSPVDGLRFRSSYGTSFRAPLLSESLGLYNVYLFPASLLYLDPTQAPPGVGAALIGSNPNVRPETSRSFSAGTEWSPSVVPGLKLRATYYAIHFTNRIALPSQQIVVVGDPTLEPLVTHNPDLALVTDLFAGAGQVLDFSGPGFTSGGAGPGDVRVIVDDRVANTAETRTSGLDLGLDYGFGLGPDHFSLSLNANKVFKFDNRLTSASPIIHTLDTPFNPVDWRGRAGLSWSRGPISAVLFANYTAGYRDNRSGASLKVGSFTTFDAGLAFTGPSAGPPMLRQLRLSLNVENLFDADPPQLLPDPGSSRGVGYDPVNATGRGRTISLQLRKHW